MLTVQNLNKTYGHEQALKSISLNIPKGSCYGLVGPNGAGKSTLMKIIANIIRADSGHIHFNGGNSDNKVKSNIGYIPQEICLEQTITAKQNLYFFGRLYGLQGEELRQRAKEILEYIGLSDKASQKVTTFSGGMKRRLNIGCALMNEPTVILMDEPTVGIDPQSRRYIYKMIENLKMKGCTIIYASHYIEEIEHLCDEVTFIDHGEIIESGSLEYLLNKHTRPTVFVKGNKGLPAFFHQHNIMAKDHGHLIESDHPLEIMKEILDYYKNNLTDLAHLELQKSRLEDVFFSLTGNQLRD